MFVNLVFSFSRFLCLHFFRMLWYTFLVFIRNLSVLLTSPLGLGEAGIVPLHSHPVVPGKSTQSESFLLTPKVSKSHIRVALYVEIGSLSDFSSRCKTRTFHSNIHFQINFISAKSFPFPLSAYHSSKNGHFLFRARNFTFREF